MNGFKKVIATTLIIASVAVGIGAYILYESGLSRQEIEENIRNFFKGNEINLDLGDAVSVSEEKVIVLGGKEEISINTSLGDIEVREHDGDDILLKLEGNVPSKYGDNYYQVSDTGTKLQIDVLKKITNLNIIGLNNYNIRITLLVPKGFKGDMNLTTVSGETLVEGLELDALSLTGVSGDMTLRDGTYGALNFKNVSGDVFSDSETGNANGDTVSGEITLTGVSDWVKLNTVSGRIKSTIGELQGTAKLVSVSGDIDVEVLNSGEVSYKLSSISGRLSAEDNGVVTKGEKSLSETFTNAKGLIDASTVSGSISIKY